MPSSGITPQAASKRKMPCKHRLCCTFIPIFASANGVWNAVSEMYCYTKSIQYHENKTNEVMPENKIDNTNVENIVTSNTGTIIKKVSDGTVYAIKDETINPDIILKDNLFDTTINDLNINKDKYIGKTVQIDGMYLTSGTYTFVGRYSTSNLCPYCPTGYSYMEYEWKGDEIPLVEEDSWIRIIGELKNGTDTSYGEPFDYLYIDAQSIEVMNEKGQETVNN